MPVEYTYKGSGQSSVSALFKKIEDDVNKIVKEAQRMVAQELGKDSARVVPYQTGQLSRSLRVYSDGQGYAVEFGAGLAYTKKVYYVTAKSGELKWTETTAIKNKNKYQMIFKKKLSEL